VSKFQPPAVSNTSVTIKDTTDPARAMLEALAPEIRNALPKHLTPERVGRICLTEIRKCPKLLKCDRQSLAAAIIQSAQLGLELGSGLGLAWLIPYGEEAQFQIGYQGLIELARRTGKLLSIYAEVVYADDEFEFVRGLNPDLHHTPLKGRTDEPKPDTIVGAYAVAELPHGSGVVKQWVWLPKYKIDKVRRASKAPNGPGWTLWYDEMAKKTALKNLCKTLPKSAELARAIEVDDAAADGSLNLVGDFTGGGDVVNVEPDAVELVVEKPEKKPRAPAVVVEDVQPYLDRITKHIEAKRFTLEQVKKLAKTDNISSAPLAVLKTIAEDLDGIATAEAKS